VFWLSWIICCELLLLRLVLRVCRWWVEHFRVNWKLYVMLLKINRTKVVFLYRKEISTWYFTGHNSFLTKSKTRFCSTGHHIIICLYLNTTQTVTITPWTVLIIFYLFLSYVFGAKFEPVTLKRLFDQLFFVGIRDQAFVSETVWCFRKEVQGSGDFFPFCEMLFFNHLLF